MKDYIRRSAKFILYIVLIFFIVLGLYPLMKYGKPISDSLREMLNNTRFTIDVWNTDGIWHVLSDDRLC